MHWSKQPVYKFDFATFFSQSIDIFVVEIGEIRGKKLDQR